ncbi:hypothetical protein DFH11DRAFT_1596760 [Phellopilus nigrolimitatus]|nr:hypothetical protein DFH11DRAFT_1596760 [Phellopilus nigrolimitatus]
MCHWRRVTNYYKRCKFSPNHPIDCLPPNCQRTCWQYRQYPEQYTPHLDRFCPACMAGSQFN